MPQIHFALPVRAIYAAFVPLRSLIVIMYESMPGSCAD